MKIDPRKKIRSVAGENIIIKQADGMADMSTVVAFNSSALELYNHLKEREFTEDDVVACLTSLYDVDPATARHDAAEWLGQMREQGLLIE